MNFTLHQLKVFETVARTGSISKAAEQLFLDQSTVSIHIRQLEKALRVELITFVNKRLEVTEAGNVLLAATQKIFAIISSTEEELSQLHGGVRGRLRIGTTRPILTHLLLPVVKEVNLRLPNALIEFVTGRYRDFALMLIAGELDLAIMYDPPGRSTLSREFYFFDRVILVARPEVLRESPNLAGVPLVTRMPGMASREIVDEWMEQEGISFSQVVERYHLEEIKDDVLTKHVVAVVSEYAVREELRNGSLVVAREPPPDFLLGRNLYFVYVQDRLSPLVSHFIEITREMLPPSLRN